VSTGSLGILPIAKEQQVFLTTHSFKLLTSPDPKIHAIVHHQLHKVAHTQHTIQVEEGEQSPFFGWCMCSQEVSATTPSGDVSSIWSGAAGAYMAMGWAVADPLHPKLTVGPGVQFLGRSQRANIIPALRASAFKQHTTKWAALKAQGCVAAHCDTIHLAMHQWICNSTSLTSREYWFTLKCHLGLLPTHATLHHHSGPTSCRACSYIHETTNHILSHCPVTKAKVIA
jgi:hypothetical protein